MGITLDARKALTHPYAALNITVVGVSVFIAATHHDAVLKYVFNWVISLKHRPLIQRCLLRVPFRAFAVSGTVPDEAVVSKKSGLVFERRLIEKVVQVRG